jgi:hypothetical protein
MRFALGLLPLLVASASGRAITAPAPALGERLRALGDEQRAALQQLFGRLVPSRRAPQEAAQPAFAGTWRTASTEGMDAYLDRAMGVGYLKRKIACKASQTQRLWAEDGAVHLEMSDKRGTARFVIRPDGRTYAGKGFMKLPMRQTARWEQDALVIDERYAQHFGGDEHGRPASGADCPTIRSWRFVDGSGRMVVRVERQLLDGETVGMKTYYTRVD